MTYTVTHTATLLRDLPGSFVCGQMWDIREGDRVELCGPILPGPKWYTLVFATPTGTHPITTRNGTPKMLAEVAFKDLKWIAVSPPAPAPATTAPALLDAAAGHMQERAKTYDTPGGGRSMGRAVTALNALLGREALSESEGWLLLQLLKDARDRTGKPHRDSLGDCIAYAALKAEARLTETKDAQ